MKVPSLENDVETKGASAAAEIQEPSITENLPRATPHPFWLDFASRFPDSPQLQLETIYALPETLINAIQLEIPLFFSAVEESFERELSKISGGGFFMKQPLSYPPILGSTLSETANDSLQPARTQYQQSKEKIAQLLAEEMERVGQNSHLIEEFFAQERELRQKIEERRWGYAGWLAVNPYFRRDCSLFRKRWGEKIAELGGFPAFPMSFSRKDSAKPPEQERDFYNEYMVFYQSWGLHTLATWDLPVPLLSGVVAPTFYPISQLSEAGLVLFVPWYLFHDKTLTLDDLSKHAMLSQHPVHLQDWFKDEKHKLGYKRYGIMLKLYIYLELCLKQRYAERMKRQVEKIRRALGHFFGSNNQIESMIYKEDNLKKIVLLMNKQLKASVFEDSPEEK